MTLFSSIRQWQTAWWHFSPSRTGPHANKAALALVVPVYAFHDTDTVFARLRRGHSWVYASIWVVPDYAAEPLPYAHGYGHAAQPKRHYESLSIPPNQV